MYIKITLRELQVHWAWKLWVAYEVSLGMNYLHTARERPVIHGDLKIRNVLIGDGFRAKVFITGLFHNLAGWIGPSATWAGAFTP